MTVYEWVDGNLVIPWSTMIVGFFFLLANGAVLESILSNKAPKHQITHYHNAVRQHDPEAVNEVLNS